MIIIKKVILITGCSSGIGKKLSQYLAKSHKIYSTSRTIDNLPPFKNITFLKMDVTKNKEINQAITKILKTEKKIDVVINNAAYGLIGSLETININQIKKMYNTNVFGTINVIKKVIPIMKKQRSGKIINISSIAGIIGKKYSSIYSSSKFAIEGLSESLYEELKEFGIYVKLVEFGYTKNTNFSKNIIKGTVKPKFGNYKKIKKTKKESIELKKIIHAISEAVNENNFKLRYIPDNYTKKRICEKILISDVPKYLE